MTVKGTRKLYTFEEAVYKYVLHCHQNYILEIKAIKEMKVDEKENIIRLLGNDGKLVYAFTPEVVVDGNHQLTVGKMTLYNRL